MKNREKHIYTNNEDCVKKEETQYAKAAKRKKRESNSVWWGGGKYDLGAAARLESAETGDRSCKT